MDERGNVIIFGGHDWTGKTEIALELSRQIGIPYFKNQMEFEFYNKNETEKFLDAMYYTQYYMIQLLKQTKYPIILDRFHESEYVYAQVMNRKTDFGFLKYIDRELAKINAKIVICYKDDLIGYQDKFINVDNAIKARDLYFEFVTWTSCDFKFLKTDSHDLLNQVKEVKEWIGR